ncbi:MAG: ABC transporter substrate-binding protein [Nocardioidaceae bacterium]
MKDHMQGRRRNRAGIAVTAIAALVSLVACSANPQSSEAAARNNSNGTIKIGSIFPPGTLDPTTGTQGSDLAYLDFTFDRLLQNNPKTGELEPMLATSWKFAGTKKLELKVSLRHGVKFQDGTPFNAQAVVQYSNDFIKAGNIGNLLQYVTNVTASGTYGVVYHLSQPNAQLPNGLAGRAGMIPSPAAVKKEGKNFGNHPVGAGPYKFVSEVQGASYKFTRYDGYWNDDKLPRVKNIEFKIFQSDTSLVTAIRGGNVNVAFHLASQDVKTLKSLSNLKVSVSPGPAVSLAYFNGSRKPFDDRRVRLAFNLALDRKSIAKAVTDGLGQAATQPRPPGTLGYVKSLDPVWKHDPARAKRLVKNAGYTNGVDITCFEYPGLNFEVAAPIIISQEKAVGINLKIVPGTPAQVGPFFTNKAKAQCGLANYTGSNAFVAYQLLWSKAYYNAGKVNFGIDQYYNKLYSTYTTAEEKKVFYKINDTEKSNPGYAIMFRAPLVNVYQKGIGGWVASPLGINHWRGLHYTS